jgi:hypothetical protein
MLLLLTQTANPLLQALASCPEAARPLDFGRGTATVAAAVKRGVLGFAASDLDRVASIEVAGTRGAVLVLGDLAVVLHFNAIVGQGVCLQGAVEGEGGFGATLEVLGRVVLMGKMC